MDALEARALRRTATGPGVAVRPIIVWFEDETTLRALFGRGRDWFTDRIGRCPAIHAERVSTRTRYYVHVAQAEEWFGRLPE